MRGDGKKTGRLSEAVRSPAYRALGIVSRGVLAAALCIDCGEPEPTVLTQERVEAGQGSFIEHVKNCGNSKGKPYQANWHHEQLAAALEKVQSGDIKRLMVLMPPRHGKSELVSRHFPAWCLGKNPDEEIIACSYSMELASKMSVAVQRIMHQPAYLDEFDTRLAGIAETKSPTRLAERKGFFEVANGAGSYTAAGIGGPITGSGMTIGLVDDPIKNRREANSETVREAIWDWWVSTFLTRGEGGAALGGEERIVVCLTPWNEDDLSGRILEQAKIDGEEWVVIRFPAVYEDEKSANSGDYVSTPGYSNDLREVGEALWAAKFDESKLARIESKNEREWVALYQCRPSPDKGNIFNRDWWQWYDTPADLPRMQSNCFTLDAAFKDLETSSYVVLQLWGIAGPNRYLLRQWRGHKDFMATLDMCRDVFRDSRYKHVITKLIEEKANGAALISMLKGEFIGIVPISPKDPKHVRAMAVQDIPRAGNVFLPRHDPESHTLVEEATTFPYGKHDDQVDAMVQMLLHYTYNPVTFLEGMLGKAS